MRCRLLGRRLMHLAGWFGARRLGLMRVRMIGAGFGDLAKLAFDDLGRRILSALAAFHRLRAHLVTPPMRAVARTAAPAARTALDLVLGVAMRALFLGDQRLPVRDRDLVIVGMDFRERQEAVAIAAVVDKGGLERRLYPGNLGEIDIAAQLA